MTVQSQFLICAFEVPCNCFAKISVINANFIPFAISCSASQIQDSFVGCLLIAMIYLKCCFEVIEHFIGTIPLIFLSFVPNLIVSCLFSIISTNLLALLDFKVHLTKFVSISSQYCIGLVFYFRFILI